MLAILAEVTAATPGLTLTTVVVDGYVTLDEHGTPGLGGHLHAALGERVAVIGVAKTSFRGSGFATPVLRGTSARPLWVTAMGTAVEPAARRVAAMHGEHRIPTLLGLVDREEPAVCCARARGLQRDGGRRRVPGRSRRDQGGQLQHEDAATPRIGDRTIHEVTPE